MSEYKAKLEFDLTDEDGRYHFNAAISGRSLISVLRDIVYSVSESGKGRQRLCYEKETYNEKLDVFATETVAKQLDRSTANAVLNAIGEAIKGSDLPSDLFDDLYFNIGEEDE